MNFLRIALAFLKRDLLESLSYKLMVFFYSFSIFSQVLTFFFISQVFAGETSAYLASYGGNYFRYVLLGLAFAHYQVTALTSISSAIGREQESGTLESLLMTPVRLETMVLCSMLWSFVFSSVRILLYLLIGVFIFGADLSSLNLLSTLVMIALTLSSLLGLGAISGGFVLAFKRGDPITYAMDGLSRFLSGVYFPVTLLPIWAQNISHFLPLSAALEGMRKALITGSPLSALMPEITVLSLFSVLLLPAGLLFFRWGLNKARKEGTLTFY